MEKRIMKYRVGDKVRVREDLPINKGYGESYVNDLMAVFFGKTVTIHEVCEDINRYKIKEDYGGWYWIDEMFEPLESENPADETNDAEEWVLCRGDINKLNDTIKDVVHDKSQASESIDCLLEAKFREAVDKITSEELKEIILRKIDESVDDMSGDIFQDILAEALS